MVFLVFVWQSNELAISFLYNIVLRAPLGAKLKKRITFSKTHVKRKTMPNCQMKSCNINSLPLSICRYYVQYSVLRFAKRIIYDHKRPTVKTNWNKIHVEGRQLIKAHFFNLERQQKNEFFKPQNGKMAKMNKVCINRQIPNVLNSE